VATCEEALRVLTPEFETRSLGSLDELEVAVAWLDGAAPGIRACVESAAERFPRRRAVDLPEPEGVGRLFMHEVAGVHAELFPENAELYGEDLRIKIERCLEVSDAEAERATRAREEYRERVEELLDGFDLLLTPTLPVVAPPIGAGAPGDLEVREELISRTFPFNVLGWPALALPCGTAEDGLPASVQLVARAGEDALVLAAGKLLEKAVSG
jgi:Asp-tRNA(Asn)/Glu-tRNA(Gln) amidotransferase A subunit family amidase